MHSNSAREVPIFRKVALIERINNEELGIGRGDATLPFIHSFVRSVIRNVSEDRHLSREIESGTVEEFLELRDLELQRETCLAEWRNWSRIAARNVSRIEGCRCFVQALVLEYPTIV